MRIWSVDDASAFQSSLQLLVGIFQKELKRSEEQVQFLISNLLLNTYFCSIFVIIIIIFVFFYRFCQFSEYLSRSDQILQTNFLQQIVNSWFRLGFRVPRYLILCCQHPHRPSIYKHRPDNKHLKSLIQQTFQYSTRVIF